MAPTWRELLYTIRLIVRDAYLRPLGRKWRQWKARKRLAAKIAAAESPHARVVRMILTTEPGEPIRFAPSPFAQALADQRQYEAARNIYGTPEYNRLMADQMRGAQQAPHAFGNHGLAGAVLEGVLNSMLGKLH